MAEEVDFRTIFARSATKVVLMTSGQLQPGQVGYATDTNEIIYRKRMNAPVNPGGYVIWSVPVAPTWASINDKPSTFTPSPHEHPWREINDKPAEYPPEYHTHSIEEVALLADHISALLLALEQKVNAENGTAKGLSVLDSLMVSQTKEDSSTNIVEVMLGDVGPQLRFQAIYQTEEIPQFARFFFGLRRDGSVYFVPEVSAGVGMGYTLPFVLGPGELILATTDDVQQIAQGIVSDHVANHDNPHAVTKSQVGLGNVDNTSDANKPVSTAQAASMNSALALKLDISAANTALAGKLSTTLKGVANGLAELDSSGKVPSSQLPSFVDDVLEYLSLAGFPVTGESGKIYIAIDTGKTYRWSGSTYAEISASLALGETLTTAYRGDRGKTAYDHSQLAGNPHGTTKAHVGLGSVDNTSDADKPISTAAQNAFDAKEYLHPRLAINSNTDWNDLAAQGDAVASVVSVAGPNGPAAGYGYGTMMQFMRASSRYLVQMFIPDTSDGSTSEVLWVRTKFDTADPWRSWKSVRSFTASEAAYSKKPSTISRTSTSAYTMPNGRNQHFIYSSTGGSTWTLPQSSSNSANDRFTIFNLSGGTITFSYTGAGSMLTGSKTSLPVGSHCHGVWDGSSWIVL